jgi:hypothetical protein
MKSEEVEILSKHIFNSLVITKGEKRHITVWGGSANQAWGFVLVLP